MRSISREKPLPPYGRAYLDHRGSTGPWISVGADAWDYANWKAFPVMVLPPGNAPESYRWPVSGDDVIVKQHGDATAAEVERVSLELLRSGARLVIAIGLPDGAKYCYPETARVAA